MAFPRFRGRALDLMYIKLFNILKVNKPPSKFTPFQFKLRVKPFIFVRKPLGGISFSTNQWFCLHFYSKPIIMCKKRHHIKFANKHLGIIWGHFTVLLQTFFLFFGMTLIYVVLKIILLNFLVGIFYSLRDWKYIYIYIYIYISARGDILPHILILYIFEIAFTLTRLSSFCLSNSISCTGRLTLKVICWPNQLTRPNIVL
jgi:hypothetical protein